MAPTTGRRPFDRPGCPRPRKSPTPGFFDGNDTVIYNLLAEENGLHTAYLDHPTGADKAAFYQCRRLAQQRLEGVQDARMARKAEEFRGHADRHESKKLSAAINAVYGPRPNELRRFTAPMDQRF
ncbi:hypothetical protein SprV_0100208200 [Sparganum proliferum]